MQSAHELEPDGYAVFRGVLDGEAMAEVAAHVEWLQEQHPDVRPEHLGHQYVAEDPFWIRLVSDPRLLDVAERFVGPDIALFASHYICKPPFDGQPVLWHQDAGYWPLEPTLPPTPGTPPMQVVTLWLAVDESTTENGCLRVIPGSHREPVAARRPVTDTANVLSSEIDAHVDESQAVDVVLAPGDVEVHHPNIIHGSGPNRSPCRRAGLTIRYIPTSTRILTPDHPCAFLLRGSAVPGVNEYRQRPEVRS